ncbi:hypothetical protein M1349_01355 [Patescibacteria group bacterium]|nr:hypothetical protein [Patescibacteria group bacterium]
MTSKQIKSLVLQSYTKEVLDQKKVTRIAKLLKRSDLKSYIKALKGLEKEKTVTVVLPDIKMKKKDLDKQFKLAFPNKSINYETDESLLVGVKIINNDLIYEFNLRDTLKRINSYIIERYD